MLANCIRKSGITNAKLREGKRAGFAGQLAFVYNEDLRAHWPSSVH